MAQELVEISMDALFKARERLDAELLRIAQDVIDRPRVTDGRTVTLKISIKPEVDPDSGFNVPYIDWAVSWSVPGHKGATTRAFVDPEDRVMRMNLHDMAGGQPQQPTLFDVQDVSARAMHGSGE